MGAQIDFAAEYALLAFRCFMAFFEAVTDENDLRTFARPAIDRVWKARDAFAHFKGVTMFQISMGSMSRKKWKKKSNEIAEDRWAQMDTAQREPWVQMEAKDTKAYEEWCSAVKARGDWDRIPKGWKPKSEEETLSEAETKNVLRAAIMKLLKSGERP